MTGPLLFKFINSLPKSKLRATVSKISQFKKMLTQIFACSSIILRLMLPERKSNFRLLGFLLSIGN